MHDGCRLSRVHLLLSLILPCFILLPSDVIVVVDHMPFLLYWQIREIPKISRTLYVLEKGLYFIVRLGTRESEVITIGMPVEMEVGEV
jgi:hypothetical protein